MFREIRFRVDITLPDILRFRNEPQIGELVDLIFAVTVRAQLALREDMVIFRPVPACMCQNRPMVKNIHQQLLVVLQQPVVKAISSLPAVHKYPEFSQRELTWALFERRFYHIIDDSIYAAVRETRKNPRHQRQVERHLHIAPRPFPLQALFVLVIEKIDKGDQAVWRA